MDQNFTPANETSSSSLFDTGLNIDDTGRQYLRTTAVWTKFLAVMGFIFLGLFGIASFYLMFMAQDKYSSRYSSGYFVGQGIVLIIVLVLYIYPTAQLQRFSMKTKAALNTGEQVQFNEALRHQRNLFKYMGILLIVLLSIYILIIGIVLFQVSRY